jgi:predicted transcriptional regulator
MLYKIMRKELVFILLVAISVLLLGCKGASTDSEKISGSSVKTVNIEDRQKAAATISNCEDKLKFLEDELRALESDLISLEDRKQELVKEVRKTRGEEQDQVIETMMEEVSPNIKQVKAKIDTLNEIIESTSCPP